MGDVNVACLCTRDCGSVFKRKSGKSSRHRVHTDCVEIDAHTIGSRFLDVVNIYDKILFVCILFF